MTFAVYKLINTITQQIYFGYTGLTLTQRLSGHKCEPRPTIISRSIQKYGFEQFDVQTIETHENETAAKQHEISLIAEYKSNVIRYPLSNGLNMTDGGEGCSGYKHSLALREKWSRERKGQFAKSKHPAWGKFGKNNPCAKGVHVFDKDSGEHVATYGSIRDAANAIGVHPSNISKCCSDKYPNTHSLKGYIFSRT